MRQDCLCDRCGRVVPYEDDVHALDAVIKLMRQYGTEGTAWKEGLKNVFPRSCVGRHIRPTATCSGSPSRAQYLEGCTRDQRYEYSPSEEVLVRAAYAAIQPAESASSVSK